MCPGGGGGGWGVGMQTSFQDCIILITGVPITTTLTTEHVHFISFMNLAHHLVFLTVTKHKQNTPFRGRELRFHCIGVLYLLSLKTPYNRISP